MIRSGLFLVAVIAAPAVAAPLPDYATSNVSAQTQSPFIGSGLEPTDAFFYGSLLGNASFLSNGSGTASGGTLSSSNLDIYANAVQDIGGPTLARGEVDFTNGRTSSRAYTPAGGALTTATASIVEYLRFTNATAGVLALSATYLVSSTVSGEYPDGDFNVSTYLYNGTPDFGFYLTYNRGYFGYPTFGAIYDVGTLVNTTATPVVIDANNVRFDMVFQIQPGVSALFLNNGSTARCFRGVACDLSIATVLTFMPDLPTGLTVEASSRQAFAGLPAPSAVPEPSVWALMIFGFGLTGTALRRRTALPIL